MRDTQRLREKIQRAALLLPLALPFAACAKEEPPTVTPVSVPPPGSASSPTVVASTTDASSTSTSTTANANTNDTATSTADDGADASLRPIVGMPPPHRPMPTCPHGSFCATKSAVAKFAASGSPKSLDCPTMLDEHDRPDALPGMPRPSRAHLTFDATATSQDRSDAGGEARCCYSWFIPCPGGRALIDESTPVVASVRRGEFRRAGARSRSWASGQVSVTKGQVTNASARPTANGALALDRDREGTRDRIAHLWLTDALSEHASIASFARATLELLAMGAPAELVAECQRAGLDEVRHAERCFELARAYGDVALEPGRLPAVAPREATFERLALDTFIEGCVGETISALCATRARDRGPDAVVKTWRLLAADETRHAALAWRTLAWIAEEDEGAVARLHPVAADMAEAAWSSAALCASDRTDIPLEGRLSTHEIAEAAADAWREIIRPTLLAMTSEHRRDSAAEPRVSS